MSLISSAMESFHIMDKTTTLNEYGGVKTEYKEGAQVKNSLIANGCEIHGTVENSVIFRNVTVACP